MYSRCNVIPGSNQNDGYPDIGDVCVELRVQKVFQANQPCIYHLRTLLLLYAHKAGVDHVLIIFVKAGHVTAVVVLIVLRCHGLMPRKKYRYVRDYTIFGTKIIENGSFRGFPVGRTRTYVPVAMLPLLVLGAGCCFCCSRSNGYAERAVAACLGSVWKLKGSLNISIP